MVARVRRAWLRQPWVVAGEIALGLAICAALVLRLLVQIASYHGPSYSVHQVVLAQGFVPWEGEHTAVRGWVLGEGGGCDGAALELIDPRDGPGGPGLLVLFDPQPEWLWQATRLPGISLLLPTGLPPHLRGPWTVTGHLTLARNEPCPANSGYVLVADPYQ
jgi:hypothetical protein